MNSYWNGRVVNFLGDSITEGCGTSGKESIFINHLWEELEFCEVRNYGIGGTRIAAQSDDGGSAFSIRYGKMADNADLIIVFGGTNDYGHGTAPIGKFEDRNTDTFYGGCHVLMEGLINKYTSKIIVIMTPLHRENENIPNNITGATLAQYVSIIKEVAEYYSLPVLDLWSFCGIQPCVKSNREMYCPDGLHPNDAGHKLIAERMIGFLEMISPNRV